MDKVPLSLGGRLKSGAVPHACDSPLVINALTHALSYGAISHDTVHRTEEDACARSKFITSCGFWALLHLVSCRTFVSSVSFPLSFALSP